MASVPLYAKELGGSKCPRRLMVTALTVSALLLRHLFGS
jgi:hypothetical protein